MAEEVVHIEKLVNEESFPIWNFQLNVVLKANGLYDIVTKETPFPEEKSEEEKNSWRKKDAKAQKYIVTSIDKKLITHIINCEHSYEMYEKLKLYFEKSTQDQVCIVLQQFYNITYEKEGDITQHISRIENLAHRLRNLKQSVDDNMIISKILCTLPENYSYFISAWESAPVGERTLEKLTTRLMSEEQRQKGKESSSEVAFEVRSRQCYRCKSKNHIAKNCKMMNEVKCFKCGETGHYAKNCKKRLSETNSETKKCSICKKSNHKEKDCFFRKNKQEKETNEKKVAFLTDNKCSGGDNTKNKNKCSQFIVDSGSSAHMSNSKQCFSSLTENKTTILVAKKNESMVSEGSGIIESENCTLQEVLYVPDLTKNLLSVNAITKNDGEVIFSKNKVTIMKNNAVILEGNKENGQYVIDLNGTVESLHTEKQKNDLDIWHRKLGHLSVTSMMKLKNMVDNMKINGAQKDTNICQVCMESKQTRMPFNKERQRASRPLQLLHTDVCGPVEPVTWDGKKYVLTILDDYTHFCKVYLLKAKSEVPIYIKEYISEAEAEKNLKVSKIRCDNGGEYSQTEFKNWCKNKGIVLDYTIPHSPQLNGKAERLNRTLFEKSRALIFDSGMNKEMWGEAIYTAVYLLNRSPTEGMSITPAEKWTEKKPDLSNLQIFGSEAYSKILGPVKKLDKRSEMYIFVGYSPNGYRLWDKNSRSIKIRRDVNFNLPEKVSEEQIKQQKYSDTEEEANEDANDLREHEIEDTDGNQNNEQDNENSLGEGKHTKNEENNEQKQTRSGRHVKLPTRLLDYDLENEPEYAMLTYEEAISGPEKTKWQEAILEEKNSLQKNKTWEMVDKSEAEDKTVLSTKWVFRKKENGKYKARLVVRGYEQKYGIDYRDTFSPVCNMSSIRIFIALAARNDYKMVKFDIKTAFLYGALDEKIYIETPESFKNVDNENQICLLKKALYGLKQAPLRWNLRFSTFLKSAGLESLKSEQCIFKNRTSDLFLAIHVDDGILISKNDKEVEILLKKLEHEFEFEVTRNPSSFLGIEIIQTQEGIGLKQTKYIKTTLERFGMQNSKSVSTPMVCNPNNENCTEKYTKYPYREAVGSLLYLTEKTRPDLSFAVNVCSRKTEDPGNQDVTNIKRIFRYLKSSAEEGIFYKRHCTEYKLVAYSDADFAGDTTTRRSTTGYVILFCGGPISWCSRRQPIVSLSSTEAEYIAAAECVKELMYIKSVIDELTNNQIKIDFYVDNQSAIRLIKTGQFNKRSKHIDVRYYFIKEKVEDNMINLEYSESEKQLADFLTKALSTTKFNFCKNQLMQVFKK